VSVLRDPVSDGVTINVAPTFATNLRSKVYAALQPRRLMSFLLALGVIVYYALRGPDANIRRTCAMLAVVLPLSRLLVIALSSIVTKSSREYLTMTLTLSDDAIDVIRWGIPKRDDWSFVRMARRQQGSIVLQLQRSFDYVLVDRSKLGADAWNRLERLLAAHGKL
jgi:hypothetical protein